ncbi:hypothetical protein [Nocardiopsis sp. MG754419]|uniref:hypothetical protein n=1 Tax=Nocardiopsis sp. MG754419 TaxID=2259865 RepID=UPI001BA86065|nr:hypothetical protein [Nocardiopsis sp. MG754419]
MHPDLSARAADLYRAERERAAHRERLIATVAGGAESGRRTVWARFRTPRRTPHV